MDDEVSCVENLIGATAEQADKNRINPDDNLRRTFDVDREKISDSLRATDESNGNIGDRELRRRRNDVEDVNVSEVFRIPISINDDNDCIVFRKNKFRNDDNIVGNIITANEVVEVEKYKVNEDKSGSRRNDNNDCSEAFITQDIDANIHRLVRNTNNSDNGVNINNENSLVMQTTSAPDRSRHFGYANSDRFSDEIIIPNAIEETIVPTLNDPSSAAGIFTREIKKRLAATANTEKHSRCMICCKALAAKYYCAKRNSIICSQQCLEQFKEQHTSNIVVGRLKENNFDIAESSQNYLGVGNVDAENSRFVEIIKCKNCNMRIQSLNNCFSWETLDFCNETCLRTYQKSFSSLCSNCRTLIHDENVLGRYRVRFGYNIRQFCSGLCLENYKNNLKICSYCQNDISKYRNAFLAPIRDKGAQKDFCSIRCIENYNKMNQPLKDLNIAEECCVCHELNLIQIEFKFNNEINPICSQSCLLAFKIVNYITPARCEFCYKYYSTRPSTGNAYSIRYDGILKRFCQETCRNNFITSNRKVYSCHWCKVKKYNFDMIQKYNDDNTVLITCSLPCLRSSITSTTSGTIKWTVCEVCRKVRKGKFCIAATEGALRYFCSFQCVRKYLQTSGAQLIQTNAQGSKQVMPDVPGPLPIITSVKSLAPKANQYRYARESASPNRILSNMPATESSGQSSGKIVLLKSPNLPSLRNVATSTKPTTLDAGVNFKPVMTDKETLTEKLRSFNLIAVPVPIYVPSPIPMFNLIHLRPMPFPLPIPIPILIPLTVHATNKLLTKVNDNHKSDNTTDPCEIDSHVTAEILAANRKKKKVKDSNTSHQSNEELIKLTPDAAELIKPELIADATPCDDDVAKDIGVQCAWGEPSIDLEEHISASTITSTSITTTQIGESAIVKNVFPKQKHNKQSILFKNNDKLLPKMRLKYFYGVNAWKRWVIAKNIELDNSLVKATLLNSDLIELEVEDLNSFLALFIQEVRKPNGDEHTPDIIYYLCLGIQQFLYEHARLDNIFFDEEYENFINSLDMICKRFPIGNDSKYIVTRIEEEHLWETKQLGAQSPLVLLNTIMFLLTKYLGLMTIEDHMQLSFSKIVKCTESILNKKGTVKHREYLRYQSTSNVTDHKTEIYHVNVHEDPLRCLVKLYDFYLSKCPKSARARKEIFYLLPKKSCTPNSVYWYATTPLRSDMRNQMLRRIKMVKEINVASFAL